MDDGPHPSLAPEYFEWWYYDASFDDGSSATVALYAAEMFNKAHKPAVLVNLLEPSGTVRYSYQESSKDKVAYKQPGEIAVGDSSIQRLEDGSYRVQASGRDASEEPVAVDLTFTPSMPGFKLGDGIVRFDDAIALAWVVPMPRASVQGTVTEGTRVRRVHGLGYHDHNWGELNLIDTMAYWYWGRISSAESTVIYADVHFRDSLGVQPFSFVVTGDATHMTNAIGDANFKPVGVRYLDDAGREVPAGLSIRAGPLALELTEQKILEADDFSRYVPFLVRPFFRLVAKPAYVRSLAGYTLSTPQDVPVRGTGAITEYMYVRQP